MSRSGQFIQGFCLPFQVIRVLVEKRETRWRYLWVGLIQALWVVAMVAAFHYRVGLSLEVDKQTWVQAWVAHAAVLFSALHLAQGFVIALSRDYHTAFTREASLHTGLVPEDEPLAPRLRVNFAWMKKKTKQRVRALWLFGTGVPVLWVASKMLQALSPLELRLFPLFASLWGAWWYVVFTAGKSARAWDEPDAGAPWFLRLWSRLGTYLPPTRMYGRPWTRATQSVVSPMASVERRPWGLMGLALARAVAALPLVRCFLRPAIPVAAAHLLAQQGRVTLSPPASAPGAAPAPRAEAPAAARLPDAGARRTG